MTQCTCFVTFLVKCRDLRALCRILAEMVAIYVLCRILAEMSRFMCFARHKFSAARHLKLFCTPDHHPGHNRYTLNTDQCPPHQSLLSTGPKECQEVSEARICPSIAISSFKVSSRFCPLYHCLSFQCHHCVKRIKGKFTFPILRNRRTVKMESLIFYFCGIFSRGVGEIYRNGLLRPRPR